MGENDESVEVLGTEPVYQGFLKVLRLLIRYRRHDGSWSRVFEREIVERRHAAVVLAYDDVRDRVLLLEQFRPGVFAAGRRCRQLEPIGGLLEPGQDPREAIRKEALEEAGCALGEIVDIGPLLPSPGFLSEVVYTYCARVDTGAVGGVHGCADEDEETVVRILGFDEAMERLRNGRFEYMVTALCLYWLAANRERLRAEWGAGPLPPVP